jgi:hypothetical protein
MNTQPAIECKNEKNGIQDKGDENCSGTDEKSGKCTHECVNAIGHSVIPFCQKAGVSGRINSGKPGLKNSLCEWIGKP